MYRDKTFELTNPTEVEMTILNMHFS